ncbi:MAG: transketolase [Bacteroidota bacterium]
MKKITNTSELKNIAKKIRTSIIKSIAEAESGHTGGSLGLADIFTVLYFNILNHNPENPDWEDRDRLILSIGHVVPVQYAALAHTGYFPLEELLTLRKLGSRLQGHPGKDHGLPGIEISSGSLGQGLSVAVGLALAAKIDNKKYYVYSIHGDGELQEGSIWEAAMSASHHKLDNIIAVIDRNNLQIDGKTCSVMNIDPLDQKWSSFGWHVIKCDGNDINEVISSFKQAKEHKGKPTVIIAKTLMGKGVKSIENNYKWHGKAPSKVEMNDFINQINL